MRKTTEYKIEVTVRGDLSAEPVVLERDQWITLEYGMRNSAQVVGGLMGDSPRALRSLDLWVDSVIKETWGTERWGRWNKAGTAYVEITVAPVVVAEVEYLGER